MEDFTEDYFYDFNLQNDRELDSIDAAEAEAALYSLVHHSEDTYGTPSFSGTSCDNYKISARNKVSRWDVIDRRVHENTTPFGNQKEPNPCLDYISLPSSSYHPRHRNNSYDNHYDRGYRGRKRNFYDRKSDKNRSNSVPFSAHHERNPSDVQPYGTTHKPNVYSCNDALNRLYTSNSAKPMEDTRKSSGPFTDYSGNSLNTSTCNPQQELIYGNFQNDVLNCNNINMVTIAQEKNQAHQRDINNVISNHSNAASACNADSSSKTSMNYYVERHKDDSSSKVSKNHYVEKQKKDDSTSKTSKNYYVERQKDDCSRRKSKNSSVERHKEDSNCKTSKKNRVERHQKSGLGAEALKLNRNTQEEDLGVESDSSIIEVNVPPKPPPPVIALDSSDELEKSEVPLIVLDSDDEHAEEVKSSPSALKKGVAPLKNVTSSKTPGNNVLNDSDLVIQEPTVIWNKSPNKGHESTKQGKMDISDGILLNVASLSTNEHVTNSSKSPALDSSTKHQKKLDKEKKKLSNKKNKANKKSPEYKKCPGMRKRMDKFYNESWGGENFNHLEMQRKMSDNPALWKILEIDEYGPARDNGCRTRCTNCNERGHSAIKCPSPRKPIVCSMCGQRGHRDFACPSKLCFRCGEPSVVYSSNCKGCIDMPLECASCGQRNHPESLCPNIWRKFHSVTTVEAAEYGIIPAAVYKPPQELLCSFCTARGHTFVNCPRARSPVKSYFPNNFHRKLVPPRVVVLGDNSRKRKRKDWRRESGRKQFGSPYSKKRRTF